MRLEDCVIDSHINTAIQHCETITPNVAILLCFVAEIVNSRHGSELWHGVACTRPSVAYRLLYVTPNSNS